MSGPEFSLVIPVFDEEASVDALAREVEDALGAGLDWECLWVDDGSRDGTHEVLAAAARRDPRHRVLRLQANSGQSAALLAGFGAARAGLLGTMDGDGQNVAADLPLMVALLRESGADMVNGRRAVRHDSWVRRASSRIANGWRNALTGESVSDVGCSIRVFRRECVRHLPAFRGMHRFLPTLIRLDGWRLVEMPVRHRPRAQGRSKYGIHNRLWVGLLDTLGVVWLKWRHAGYRVRPEGAHGQNE